MLVRSAAGHAVPYHAAAQAHVHGARPWPPRLGVPGSSRELNRGRWHRAGLVRRSVLSCPHPGADCHRHLGHELGAPVQGQRASRGRDPGRVRRAVRLDLGRLLDRADGLLSCWCAAATATPSPPPLGTRHRFADDARTAIVMPICNEDVARVFAGLRATYESLARTGAARALRFLRAQRQQRSRHAASAETQAWLRAVPRASTASAASSTAGASTASSARAATSPTSAGAGAATTATWSCSMPTAS